MLLPLLVTSHSRNRSLFVKLLNWNESEARTSPGLRHSFVVSNLAEGALRALPGMPSLVPLLDQTAWWLLWPIAVHEWSPPVRLQAERSQGLYDVPLLHPSLCLNASQCHSKYGLLT